MWACSSSRRAAGSPAPNGSVVCAWASAEPFIVVTLREDGHRTVLGRRDLDASNLLGGGRQLDPRSDMLQHVVLKPSTAAYDGSLRSDGRPSEHVAFHTRSSKAVDHELVRAVALNTGCDGEALRAGVRDVVALVCTHASPRCLTNRGSAAGAVPAVHEHVFPYRPRRRQPPRRSPASRAPASCSRLVRPRLVRGPGLEVGRHASQLSQNGVKPPELRKPRTSAP